MDRTAKADLIQEMNQIFNGAVSGILVDYKGATVEELTTLRKTLHGQKSRFRVLKNTLAKIAAKDTPFEELSKDFVQTCAFVYSEEDVVACAKIMTKVVGESNKLKLIAGTLVSGEKGQLLDIAGIKALGDLPSKEDLLVKLLFLMNAPATNFVRVLNEVPGSFVRVLKSIADSKK